MMTQTLAIFRDAYRELNAKKLFWIVMVISGLVVAAFAAIGINSRGVTFFHWEFEFLGITSDLVSPAQFYKGLFEDWGIGIWLAWIASILALISTASIFPDFIAGGAIELTLAKPIGRLRLFMTKYLAGMLFVTLQVTVFSIAAFLVIGLRGGVWEVGLFLAIPIVVCLFSYLFSICTLLGLITRSTIASLLLTLLFWFFLFLLNAGDAIIMQGTVLNEMSQERVTKQIATLEKAAAEELEAKANEPESEDAPEEAPKTPASSPDTAQTAYTRQQLDAAQPELIPRREELEETIETGKKWRLASRIATGVKTVFPKTSETVELLGRTLKTAEELAAEKKRAQAMSLGGRNDREMATRMEEKFRGRTIGWVLGTSLAFEAIVLALSALIFCRRDF